MAEITPFEETLYLDCDTMVMGPLDFGFKMAQEHDLACCICECPWARRFNDLHGDQIEYNTGVIFFTKSSVTVFHAWSNFAIRHATIQHHDGDKVISVSGNDQGGFAMAVADSQISPFVLPLNWNFRPDWHRSFFGPLKIWHHYADVPDDVQRFSDEQSDPDSAIRYMEFHRNK